MEMADFKELTEKRIQAMTTTTKCANDKLQADMNNLKTTLREKVTELQVNSSFNFKERDIIFQNLLLNVEKKNRMPLSFAIRYEAGNLGHPFYASSILAGK